jgi:predicted GH43/DUF377 family glycosyl hydrolase
MAQTGANRTIVSYNASAVKIEYRVFRIIRIFPYFENALHYILCTYNADAAVVNSEVVGLARAILKSDFSNVVTFFRPGI